MQAPARSSTFSLALLEEDAEDHLNLGEPPPKLEPEAGMLVCALLDAFEIAAVKLMRCKFPEFVKLNLGVLFAIVVWLTDFSLLAVLAE